MVTRPPRPAGWTPRHLVIALALQLIGHRLRAAPAAPAAPAGQRTAARLLLSQVELLWRRQIIQYILLRAVRP
jgi:hypothetical protein